MGRPAGSPNRPDREARRILSQSQFLRGVQFTKEEMANLNRLALLKTRERNAGVSLSALRLKMEYGYSKPAQEHELSGSVTIVVTSPLLGSPGSGVKAKALPVATMDAQALSLQQGPITANMSTRESAEIRAQSQSGLDYVTTDPDPITDPEGDPLDPDEERPFDPMTAPSIIEAGKLIATDDATMTAGQRRAKARDDWKAEQAALNGCDKNGQGNV